MKTLFNLTLLLIILNNAYAQTGIWEYYAPLPIDGGNVSKIVVDTNNTILFEYTKDFNGGSLFSSSDKGLTFNSEDTRWLQTTAIEINPKYYESYLGLAYSHLIKGNFSEGWYFHEYRSYLGVLDIMRVERLFHKKTSHFLNQSYSPSHKPKYAKPKDGSKLSHLLRVKDNCGEFERFTIPLRSI